MSLTRAFWIGAPLVALAVWLPPTTPATEGADPGREAAKADSAAAGPTAFQVLAGIERYWARGEVDSLLGTLAADEVRLRFRRIGPREGTFDSPQARYLLADLFAFARTDSFIFVQYGYDPSGERPPEAVGRWYFRGAGTVEREARVTIQLKLEDGTWAVAAIGTEEW
jgi:hypothetical protein